MLRTSIHGLLSLLSVGAATGCLLLMVCGCDQIAGNPVVQIIGEVRIDRKPLADAMVAFIPLQLRSKNGKIIDIAFGRTDDVGRFELRTSEARGVLPGEYRILFFGPSTQTQELLKDQIVIQDIASENLLKGITAETSVMLAAINRLFESTTSDRSKIHTVSDVPVSYNLQSNLRFTVKPGGGIIYPKFELDAHPKN